MQIVGSIVKTASHTYSPAYLNPFDHDIFRLRIAVKNKITIGIWKKARKPLLSLFKICGKGS